ncbi:hypothetical protein EMIHUDRAFT_239366 [Emiliania huxleyi CCMP1516]|uniref:Uncharacterized protein n=2 Tax=Emiliania huxleyi TaxID=2903 RepID=A0A0D3JJF6_EMIH1|nr:hypothetical protein EMIHUDRAFT_239366 [Emiliania huxleyi CCMP1516]EOD23641.1 hypothetical protein EMIHUDRAFT_239366 [Emiliania huxleyi CCMP1516]|eukprot:XP_005776070.1 hypothetical protein EMIHUDRAFT_239366 [Emiliania huxleyi CCMP1516]
MKRHRDIDPRPRQQRASHGVPSDGCGAGAVLWLARELSTSPTWQQRMAVVVSHDRSRGNYSGWAKRRAQQQLTHEREMESKRRMIAELRAFKPLGSTPKRFPPALRQLVEGHGLDRLQWDRPSGSAQGGLLEFELDAILLHILSAELAVTAFSQFLWFST